MKVVSLFAGIGGFDLALTRLGHEIVYANEWDKYAADTYEKNFKHRPDTRDIRTIPTSDIPDGFDLLVGGFPCQAFSIAGRRRGFDDTRGTLFFDIARILKDKKPGLFLLENVKGLLSHDSGRTFKIILTTLTDLGYDVQWQVLNSKDFGVPQNRERVFIIGHLRGEPRPKVFPIQRSNTKDNKSQTSQTLTSNYYKTPNAGNYVETLRTHKDGKGFRVMKSGLSPTIPARAREDGSGQPIIAHTIRVGGQGSYGKKQNWDSYFIEGQIRRLTPLECERLQGFSDNWTIGSDTQRYKQLGNAVTVNVVQVIAERLVSKR